MIKRFLLYLESPSGLRLKKNGNSLWYQHFKKYGESGGEKVRKCRGKIGRNDTPSETATEKMLNKFESIENIIAECESMV